LLERFEELLDIGPLNIAPIIDQSLIEFFSKDQGKKHEWLKYVLK
jgi:hypothetical protein